MADDLQRVTRQRDILAKTILLIQERDKGHVVAIQFLDAVLSACDASNWDADGNTGDYYRGLHDAYEAVQQIATGYQPALYAVFPRPHEGQPK